MKRKMKIKKSELLKIIKEEMRDMKRQSLLKERKSAATSKLEVEQLLSIYAKNAGGLPEDITKLSVLFPILERCGLSEIVDDYIETAKEVGRDAAREVLDPVKEAIKSIKAKQQQMQH